MSYFQTDDFFKEGLIHSDPYGVSGNGLLYTAEYVLALKESGLLYSPDILEDISLIRQAYRNHQIVPGLMQRTLTNSFGQEGPDDYWGIGIVSFVINCNCLNYGQKGVTKCLASLKWYEKLLFYMLKINGFGKVKYVYNNINQGMWTPSSWLGRFPHLIAHLKFGSLKNPTLFEKLYWSLSMLIPYNKEDHDKWILSWLAVNNVHKSWICEQVGKIWRKRAAKVWTNPYLLLKAYFERSGMYVNIQDGADCHPTVKILKDYNIQF